MAAQRGKEMLLSLGDGEDPEVFTTVAMQRQTGLSINGETVDVTNKDSDGFRELLDGGNVRSLTMTCEGIFADDSSQTDVEELVLDGSINNWQVVMDDGRSYEMGGVVTAVEYAAPHDDVQNYSITVESHGEPDITAAS